MKRRTMVLLLGTVVAAGVAGLVWGRERLAMERQAPSAAAAAGIERVVPAGTRVRVEVLNTSSVRGLARRATFHLRDLGFDVVRYAGEGPERDATLILDRTGHPEWAAWVSTAFGGARVESRPDTSRYVDITVLIGATWRPPAEPFYP
ncbi:MAG: LytR C-terminal domain-containing protein [Gemmatimonadaceae bacterium]